MAYDIFATLGDSTRRTIFESLRRHEQPVGAIAKQAGISQPAASQHLRVLKDARLVSVRSEGTRRLYRAELSGLEELRRYLDSMWGDVLESFANHLAPATAINEHDAITNASDDALAPPR